MLCTILCYAFFTQHNVLEMHSHCCMVIVYPFLLLCNVLFYEYTTVCLSVALFIDT